MTRSSPDIEDAFGITDSDREFAIQIIEDFGTFEEGIDDDVKLTQWVRNIRRAAVVGVAQRMPMQADIVQIIAEGWRYGKSAVDITEEIWREFEGPDVTPPRDEPQTPNIQLQARPAEGGDWTDIFPAQLQWMAKEGHEVRAIEQCSEETADAWHPIETAPKGKLLLVGFFNSAGKWRSMHAQYRDDLPQHDDADDDDEPAEAGWYEGSLEAEMLFPVRPTHWMLIPAPPLSRPHGGCE